MPGEAMFPVVDITVRKMQATISHALHEHLLEIDKNGQEALKKAIEEFDFDREVRRCVEQVLKKNIERTIERAVWELFSGEDGISRVLMNAVVSSLREIVNAPDKAT